jgi:RNA polymerase sigma-70 factor, ECF subfamily
VQAAFAALGERDDIVKWASDMAISEGRSRVRTAPKLGSSQPSGRVSFAAEGATMAAAQSHPPATRVRRPVRRQSVEAELRGRFEHEAVPLRDLLYRHACRMSRNHADAEDLVQETMMKAYKGFHSFRRDTNMRAWLLRILVNSYISDYRKRRREPVQYSTEEVTEQRLMDTYTRSAPAALHSAEDQALNSLSDNDLKSAMQALPRQFRDVVYYADVEGLRYQEIAVIMNTPTGTVASQLYRGRRQLRKLLSDRVSSAGTATMSATA